MRTMVAVPELLEVTLSSDNLSHHALSYFPPSPPLLYVMSRSNPIPIVPKKERCIICRNRMDSTTTAIRTLFCDTRNNIQHRFCEFCARQWFRKSKKCPYCRCVGQVHTVSQPLVLQSAPAADPNARVVIVIDSDIDDGDDDDAGENNVWELQPVTQPGDDEDESEDDDGDAAPIAAAAAAVPPQLPPMPIVAQPQGGPLRARYHRLMRVHGLRRNTATARIQFLCWYGAYSNDGTAQSFWEERDADSTKVREFLRRFDIRDVDDFVNRHAGDQTHQMPMQGNICPDCNHVGVHANVIAHICVQHTRGLPLTYGAACPHCDTPFVDRNCKRTYGMHVAICGARALPAAAAAGGNGGAPPAFGN
jgi:hypothetical protein